MGRAQKHLKFLTECIPNKQLKHKGKGPKDCTCPERSPFGEGKGDLSGQDRKRKKPGKNGIRTHAV
jgi:hypothetical protein